jgi:outer membrane autotransporter protein
MGLSFASKTISSLPLFLGLQAETNMTLWNGMTWLPSARVSLVHEFEPTRDVSATFVTLPTAAFTVEGPRAARDAARVDIGSKLFLSDRVALFGRFIGEFSGRSQTLAATGGIKVAW